MMLLDTHALLWWQAGGRLLSRRAAREIARADTLLVSPVSCWEVAMLSSRGRIALDREIELWVADLFQEDAVAVAPLSVTAAVAAARLGEEGFHGDPADRFLYATARELRVPLVTKDRHMHRHAAASRGVRLIW